MLTIGVLLVALFACAAVDFGYEGLYRTNADILTPERKQCFDIPGLPASLRGTYVIGGPAVFEYGGLEFQSVLDGFGKMNRIELRDSKGCFATDMLQSSFWNSSVKAGHVAPAALFYETKPPRKCPLLQPACNMKAVSDNNWVNSAHLAGESNKLLLLTDTPRIMEYNISSMKVSGWHKFDDHITSMLDMQTVGSAHPHKYGNGGVADFVVESGLLNYINIYHVDPSSPSLRTLLARYSSKSLPYMHSFGMTTNYAVMPHNIDFDIVALLMSDGILSRALHGKFDGVNVVKLDRSGSSASSNVIKFHPNPFYHLHVVNTYENASGIVFDVSTYQEAPLVGPMMDLNAARSKSLRDADQLRGVITRYHFALTDNSEKGVTTEQVLSYPTRSTDFPQINQNFAGKPYCIYYAVEWFHDERTFASMAVLKHNICTEERTYWFRDDWYPSEAIFVPGGVGESDGVLLFLALNGRSQTSHLVVADARNMHTLAEAQLPLRIPFTGHAQFFETTSLAGVDPPNSFKSPIWV